MKIYTEGELTPKATQFFLDYPGEDACYATEDGNVFISENRALLQARAKNLKIYEFLRGEYVAKNSQEIDILDGNVASVVNAIPFLSRTDAEALLIAEGEGKNRKTVIKALEEFLASIPESITLSASSGSVPIGGTKQVELSWDPPTLPKPEVYWKSNGPGLATVDENGLVTGVGNGSFGIVATTKKGRVTAFINLTAI